MSSFAVRHESSLCKKYVTAIWCLDRAFLRNLIQDKIKKRYLIENRTADQVYSYRFVSSFSTKAD